MKEMSAALRQLADQIEASKLGPDASECVVVLANPDASSVSVTHLGRMAPAKMASLVLLAAGVHKMATADLITQQMFQRQQETVGAST